MRIYLRALELSDYKLINKWRTDKDIIKNLGSNRYFISSERDNKWVEERIFNDKKDITLAVCLKENDKMIGYTSIKDIDHLNKKAEWAGIIIGEKENRGKGISYEIQHLALKYLFCDLGMHRVYAHQLETNKASISMVEKIGFKVEGILRECLFKDGQYRNLLLISILKNEFETLNNGL